jgi:hypothetical protein
MNTTAMPPPETMREDRKVQMVASFTGSLPDVVVDVDGSAVIGSHPYQAPW